LPIVACVKRLSKKQGSYKNNKREHKHKNLICTSDLFSPHDLKEEELEDIQTVRDRQAPPANRVLGSEGTENPVKA
jgi:hypothetical protein